MECNVNSHTHDGFNMLLSVFLFFVNKIVAIIKGGSDRKPNLILNLCEHYTMIWGHYWIFALSEWVATEHWLKSLIFGELRAKLFEWNNLALNIRPIMATNERVRALFLSQHIDCRWITCWKIDRFLPH